MANQNEQPTYLDLGFDLQMTRVAVTPQPLSDVLENSVSDRNVKNISADKITTGTLKAVTNVGDDSIVLDGENKTIKIYDNSTPPKVSIYMKGGAA